jgi:hypothetical protein
MAGKKSNGKFTKDFAKKASRPTGGKAMDETSMEEALLEKKSNGRSNKRRTNRNGNRGAKNPNVTLGRMNYETPVSSSGALVFANDSMAMQAFGNYTTTPGQDNFIASFNEIKVINTDHPHLKIQVGEMAKRAANAMVIGITPWFGSTEPPTRGMTAEPMTLASLNLKQFIDTSFGTNTGYDPEDLMIYIMAVYSVFPYIAELKRDLRLAYTCLSDQYPQFVPNGLFEALRIPDENGNYENGEGILYTSAHLRGFVDQLNQLILAFNRLPMPPEILAFQYNDDFFQHIYMDSEDPNTAQLYVFRNEEYWLYQEDLLEKGPCLINLPTGYRSIQARLLILSSMIRNISALRTSSVAMLQNLFNAYGSKDTIQVATMNQDAIEPLDFVYDKNFLTMIENMVVCNPDRVELSWPIANAETSKVEAHACIYDGVNGMSCCINLPLQFHIPWDQVSHADVGWALRLHPIFHVQTKKTIWGEHFQNPEGSLWDSYYADNKIGFAVCRSCEVVQIKDDGTLKRYEVKRGGGTTDWTKIVHDFKAYPIPVQGSWHADTGVLEFLNYTANRDVEVTYRQEDIEMHWLYLTNTLWAANVNRNAPGTRYKGKSDPESETR